MFIPLNAVNMRISCKTANIEKAIVIQAPEKIYGTNDLSFIIDIQNYLQKKSEFMFNKEADSNSMTNNFFVIKVPTSIITKAKIYMNAGNTVKFAFSGVLDSLPNMMLPIKEYSFTNNGEAGVYEYDINLSLVQYKEAYLHFLGGCGHRSATAQYGGVNMLQSAKYGDGTDPTTLTVYGGENVKYYFSINLEYLIDPEEGKENPETMVLSDTFKGKDYVSYGDSITAYARDEITQEATDTYGLCIANYFGFNHINKGASGSVPVASGSNNNNLTDANLEYVTENTMLVTISGGQNQWVTAEDINSEDRSTSIGAINYYIDQIRLRSPKCVIILCPTYIGNGDSQCSKDYQRIADNKHVGLAPTLDLHLIDWEGDKSVNLLRYDNVHLTGFGAKKFAAVVREYARQFFF